jgi:hypothetical protein
MVVRERGSLPPPIRTQMEIFPYTEHHIPNILPISPHLNLNSITHLFTNQCKDTLHHDNQLHTIRHNDHNTHFYFKADSCLCPFYIQNHRISLKPMPAKYSLNTLGGKSYVSGSAIIYLVLICSRLIVRSWIFSFTT